MPSKFAEVTSRNFSPKLAPELSDEARKAVNAAFDAMSTWRTETVVAQMAAFNPFGMHMQIAQQWQKTWSDAMGVWLAHLIVTIGIINQA